jgi:2-C-methyl-D-erythritol 4-phosphate cytidylyltransferase
MKKYAIIVAGGFGQRMESDIPKQFLELGNKPILMRTIKVFHKYDRDLEIIVVIPPHFSNLWKELCKDYQFTIKHQVVSGGKTRFESVRSGIKKISEEGLVAIHDGVRPLIKLSIIDNAFKMAKKHGSAVPVISLNDSVRIVNGEHSKPVDRKQLRIIQTPQVFKTDLIAMAYEQKYMPDFTDDATVFESMGQHVHLIDGDHENLKITRKTDMEIARALLKAR